MSISLEQNYFSLFEVPESFSVDLDLLSTRYLTLQGEAHPDRYASEGAAQQRIAMQFAAHINLGLETLKSPLKRAEYLLARRGVDIDFDTTTNNDIEFLMQQMELREELSDIAGLVSKGDASVEPKLANLIKGHAQLRQESLEGFSKAFDATDFTAAKSILAKLHFIEKFGSEIRHVEDDLLDL